MKHYFYIFFLFLANPIFSIDVIYMTNEDKISGSITEMSKEFILIETEYGSLKINRRYVMKAELSSTDIATQKSKNLLIEYLFNNNYNNSSTYTVQQKVEGKGSFVSNLNSKAFSCLENSGQENYIIINSLNLLESYNDFCISFWVYPTDSKRTQYIFSQWNSTKESQADGKLALCFKNDVLIIYLVSDDGFYHTYTIPGIIEYNTWQSIIVNKNNSTLDIIKNKNKIKTITLNYQKLYTTTAEILLLTAKYSNTDFSSYNFRGRIDQIQFFNQALSDKEIENLMIIEDSKTPDSID